MGQRDDVETTSPRAAAAAEEGEDASQGALDDVEALRAQLADAREEAQSNWDRYLRAAAEIENVRRRSAQELERVQRFSLERFAAELLSVKDSLEMGLAAADEEASLEALREGTAATLKLLAQVFEKFGVTEIDPAGAAFDPTVHEAISVRTSPDAENEQVLTVVQKGYLLNGRLLRPARVIVARPATSP
jgi:molecular chaperone GrpE